MTTVSTGTSFDVVGTGTSSSAPSYVAPLTSAAAGEESVPRRRGVGGRVAGVGGAGEGDQRERDGGGLARPAAAAPATRPP